MASGVRDVPIRVVRETGFRVSVQLGRSGESVSLSSAADGLWRLEGDPVWRGQQVTAGNGNVYSLAAGTDGTLSATFVPEVQVLKLAAGEFVRLTRDEAGAWRVGPDAAETPYRHVQGGREYVLELEDGQWRVASYTVLTVAGNGDAVDGVAATASAVAGPCAVAVDAMGNTYVADDVEHRVRKIDAGGVIETHAGTGNAGRGGARAVATEAELNGPCGVAVDAAGNLYVADTGNHEVRRIDAAGTVTTIAGTGDPGYGGDGGPGARAQVAYPTGVAVDPLGNVFVADMGNHRVRRIDGAGIISTVVGTGTIGYSGDGKPAAQARIAYPGGVAADSSGNLYLADTGNQRVRKIDAAGTITTFAGTGESGYSGDGGSAARARIGDPVAITVDAAGKFYVADRLNRRVRRIDRAGVIKTLAGTGASSYGGDGGPGPRARFHGPAGVALDGLGNVYVADSGNHRVRKIDAAGIITTLAGTGAMGYGGDGGPAAQARLQRPSGVAADSAGNVYVADSGNHRIRRIDAAGTITTLAGTGTPGYSGDGGPAARAQIAYPSGVAVDVQGNVYVADGLNHRVRRIDATGTITTLAGTGTPGYDGDGGPATHAQLSYPVGVAADTAGNVFVADSVNYRIRRVDARGVVTTVAGTGEIGVDIDGIAATASRLSVTGIAVDIAGNIWFADTANRRVRVLERVH